MTSAKQLNLSAQLSHRKTGLKNLPHVYYAKATDGGASADVQQNAVSVLLIIPRRHPERPASYQRLGGSRELLNMHVCPHCRRGKAERGGSPPCWRPGAWTEPTGESALEQTNLVREVGGAHDATHPPTIHLAKSQKFLGVTFPPPPTLCLCGFRREIVGQSQQAELGTPGAGSQRSRVRDAFTKLRVTGRKER